MIDGIIDIAEVLLTQQGLAETLEPWTIPGGG
jgi:hypothetical protein